MPQTVATGQLVADRFHIVRFIDEGGMGEVYEADDRVLGERVALKFLSHRSIGDERVKKRFRREIQLARKVTHRNVCRLHDLYQHTPTEGLLAGREVAFVTMELLQGETLEHHLHDKGKLTEDEALPLVLQMADALAAAHAAGVIHRDFKTSNVMLVPGDGEAEELRAVVTDFGLARTTVRSAEDTLTPLTGETRIVGTADYMSPEQLYGEEISPASDVYALGVVIFEMMTGKKPYSASNPMSLLAKRVSEPPASPRDFEPNLDEHWESVILDCLKNDSAERLATPRDVVGALLGEDSGLGTNPSGSMVLPASFQRESGADRNQARRRRGWILVAALLAGITAGAVLWWSLSGPPAPTPMTSFNPVQLTTSAGLELDPTFSPDGTALAYSSDQGGSFEIYIRDLTPGGRESRLTDDGGQNFEPAWSPDGSSVAYHSKEKGGIWTIPTGGGAPSRLTQFGSRPAWAPDSSQVAFQSESSPQLSDTASPALALSTLWLVRRSGEDQRQLTLAGQPPGAHAAPAFSPDGRRIAFSVSPQRGASEIWSVGIDGEGLSLVASEPSTAYDPTYAADGRSVYFSALAREVNSLWQVPVSPKTGEPTGEPVQIANLGLASIRQLATTADGSRMAYAAMKTISNLWTLPIALPTSEPAGTPSPLTHGTGRNNRPDFSPDGDRLAFDRWQHGFEIAIWVMGADGEDTRQLTVEPWTHTQASWLPDGSRLAYLSRKDDTRGLWSFDLRSGAQEQLAELGADVDWASLSPDGNQLAYHSRSQGLGFNLWILDLAGGESRQLTFADDFMGFPCWSKDGAWLAFQHKKGEDSHLMVMPAAGGEPLQLTFEPGQNWPFSFSPDGDKVAFAALRDGEWNLWWVSRSTGEQHRLTESPRLNAYVRYPAWSPRGDRIIYEMAETTGDIWLVESGG
ncbi:MAG: protein kinase [bacterium]|nr:protein kinase [bacterium]